MSLSSTLRGTWETQFKYCCILGILFVFLFAIDLPEIDLSIFFNLPSIMLVIGGGIAFTIFTSTKKENLGGYLSLGFAFACLIGTIGGIIQMFPPWLA